MSEPTGSTQMSWKQTACILCECNCGIEVRVGADDRTFERIRGDKAHPGSKGYTCEKALRLNHYQNGRSERVLQPQRRRPDGTFETIDWDTAIREVAERFGHLRDTYGGASIMYYGGGGQGNHLGGAYCTATRNAFGMKFRSNALAQEKTGEFWVNGRMLGTAGR
jgi:anaerobic selenocysteine-containing dehydrogenase